MILDNSCWEVTYSTENGLSTWLDSSYKEIYKKDRFLLYSNDFPFFLDSHLQHELSTITTIYSSPHVTAITLLSPRYKYLYFCTRGISTNICTSLHVLLEANIITQTMRDAVSDIYSSSCGVLSDILDFILKCVYLDQAYISSAPEHALWTMILNRWLVVLGLAGLEHCLSMGLGLILVSKKIWNSNVICTHLA